MVYLPHNNIFHLIREGKRLSEVNRSKEFLLLDRYLSGDAAAGEELFGSIYPAVRRYVFSQTSKDTYFTESDKEDIVADAMMRAIDKQHLFNGSSQFTSFVIGFAKNIIFVAHKNSARQASKIVSIEDDYCLKSINFFDNPLNVVIEKEQLETVHKALALLPEEQRTVLTLRLFNDMPFKQVASLAGKSDDAVDSLFRRALRAFKNNFEKIYNSPTDF